MSTLDELGYENISGFKCPECKEKTTFLEGYSESCETCGDHSAVRCEECGETFDCVWGYEKIRDFNNES